MTSVRNTWPWRLRNPVLLSALTAVAGAAAVTLAAETPRIESAWSAEAPAVDGKLTEWSSPLVSLESAPLSLGVRNDGQFLYVALASSDQATRMMLGAAGFTVWMDPSGKSKKTFGISIPPAMAGGRGMRSRGEPPQGQPAPPAAQGQEGRGEPPQGGPGGPGGPMVGTITSIEVLGASKDDQRRFELSYARTIGLDVAARMAEGVLVYELRVPLPVSDAQPYGVRSLPGATIGLGIETNQMPRPEGRGEGGERGRSGMGGGPPGGGMGGMGGMSGGGGQRGGMGGGAPGGGREGMRELKPIKTWTVVHLAKAPG